jgi:BASS family bile acid:Na+ symporter
MSTMFDDYPQYEYLLAQVQLVLFMLGMGANLSGADFVGVFRRPKFLLVGLGCQFALTPLLAVLINRWGELEPGIAVGLILVAAMPGGVLSKVFAYLGHGNLALTITLTVIGTLASVVTVPVLLRVLALGRLPDDFEMPAGAVVRDVALYLLLPLGVGLAMARWVPAWRRGFSKVCIWAGFVFVLIMVVGSLGSGRIHPGDYGWRVPIAIILFCLACQQVSMLPFRLLRWPNPDCLAVGVEMTMRNLNLALLLKALLFPAEKGADPIADGVLFVILFYAGAALGAGIPLVLHFRHMARKAAAAPTKS